MNAVVKHQTKEQALVPLAHESTIIARCQSARSVHGRAAETWSYEDSAAWLRNAARVKRHGVTVPKPLCQPAQGNTPTPVECAQAGSSLPSGVSCDREHEHTSGRQSQRNPFIGDEAPEVIERYADIRGV